VDASCRRLWKPFLLVLLMAAAGLNSVSANVGTAGSSVDGSADSATEAGPVSIEEALASWNPKVSCTPDLVTVAHILGRSYPDQSLNGSPYQRDSISGGVPHSRALSPPCTMTNATGQVVGTFVQVENVYLSSYRLQISDCSQKFKGVNGGAPYPNNQTFCDNQGVILAVRTTSGFMEAEIDQDWLAAGYCGPGVPSCDNVTLAQYVSDGSVPLNFQGFVYWDGENWELHPVTAWALGSPSTSNFPRGIHLSYLNDPTSAAVTWHTSDPADARAEWGPTVGGPYPSSAAGVSYASPGGSYLHTATLTGLTPGTRYYYRVGNGSATGSSGELSFRAALPNGSTDSFTFAAAGDWSDSPATEATARNIRTRDPNLVVSLGDQYYSPNETVIGRVFDKFQAFGQGSFVQFVIGNHEYAENDTSFTPTAVHCAFVNQIGNERTYAFTYGNTLFVAIDWGPHADITNDGVDASGASCGGMAGNAAIRSWLNATLAAASKDPNIKWKVVLQHHQCYDVTTEPHALMCPEGNQTLDQEEDILNARGVDLVLTAHEHSYGRTHPVRFHSVVQSGTSYNTPGTPVYFVLGTGGFGHTTNCGTEDWIAVCRAMVGTHGFGHFTVSPTTIRYEFVDNLAGVVDAFTLTKTPPSDYAVRLEPTSLSMRAATTATARVDVIGASTSPVTLSVSGCPAQTSCVLSPTTGSPAFSSTLRIDAGSAAPVGTFDVVLTARNATVSRTGHLALTIANDVTVSFTKGDGGLYSETDDVYIYNGAPDTNFGADPGLFVDDSGCLATGTICKTLIKFPSIIGPNAGQIPAGSTILSARLDLTITNKGITQDLYQVTQSWSENGATWNGFSPAGFPATKPREFAFAPTIFGRFSINLTSIVQRWVNGEANEGILLASTSADGVDYESSESTNKPTLTVTFRTGSVPPPSFDFSVSANPSSGSVAAGGTASTTVTATLRSGSSHDVQWSCSGLPTGTTCVFTPPACSPTCSASLAIRTTSSTPTGTYVITIVATDGTLSRSTTYSLAVGGASSTLSFQKGDGGAYSETDDAFIVSSRPTKNFGGDSKLRVDAKDCVDRGGICRTLLMFPNFIGPNAGQVPSGSSIVSATLLLTVTDPGGLQELLRVTERWNESGVTWNAFAVPGSPGTTGAAISFASPKGKVTVDITAIVQAWVNGEANLGILIRTASTDLTVFGSSESGTRPKLTVTFGPPPLPPMGGPAGSTGAPIGHVVSGQESGSSLRMLEARTREFA
jgi:hypothetical protein